MIITTKSYPDCFLVRVLVAVQLVNSFYSSYAYSNISIVIAYTPRVWRKISYIGIVYIGKCWCPIISLVRCVNILVVCITVCWKEKARTVFAVNRYPWRSCIDTHSCSVEKVTHAILLLLAFANHPLILFEPHRAMYC